MSGFLWSSVPLSSPDSDAEAHLVGVLVHNRPVEVMTSLKGTFPVSPSVIQFPFKLMTLEETGLPRPEWPEITTSVLTYAHIESTRCDTSASLGPLE